MSRAALCAKSFLLLFFFFFNIPFEQRLREKKIPNREMPPPTNKYIGLHRYYIDWNIDYIDVYTSLPWAPNPDRRVPSSDPNFYQYPFYVDMSTYLHIYISTCLHVYQSTYLLHRRQKVNTIMHNR
ncbi:hypothetical protein F4814DRAFT_310597 [Daldinia grandis]|nr:hypothetical protein F4814DRAFT_310597 [Daldinia grandis]